MAKVTQNGRALQMIFPAAICEEANIRAGNEYDVTSFGNVVSLIPKEISHQNADDDSPVIYTIGYESRTLDKFIWRLKSNGIQQVIDVRELPISRKKGFSKNTLKEILNENGIKYVHLPELGSPSDLRHEYKNGGSELQFFSDYQRYVDENCRKDIQILEQYASMCRSAMMCFELTYVHCHRKILAEKLALDGYRVVHL
ncbi:MAG: DUF488 domain-containing protein [Candidatus Methanomethylophilaceae archaeon]|nr:DUF488 domain-containing protein [Candidatus Methanomethylophilaceae archaeon]